MCREIELSNKEDYPTFARTETIGRQLTPAVREVLRTFNWKRFGIFVEESEMFKAIAIDIEETLKKDGYQMTVLGKTAPPSIYRYNNYYAALKENLLRMSKMSRSKHFFRSLIVLFHM